MKPILDATAGYRHMWNGRGKNNVVFMDKRSKVKPDIVGAWANLPFRDNCFQLVIFDPPHIIWDEKWKRSVQRQGILDAFSFWTSKRQIAPALFKAIKEFHRVSNKLCFKWCDTRDGTTYKRLSSIFRGLWEPFYEHKFINKGFGSRFTWWVTMVSINSKSLRIDE